MMGVMMNGNMLKRNLYLIKILKIATIYKFLYISHVNWDNSTVKTHLVILNITFKHWTLTDSDFIISLHYIKSTIYVLLLCIFRTPVIDNAAITVVNTNTATIPTTSGSISSSRKHEADKKTVKQVSASPSHEKST